VLLIVTEHAFLGELVSEELNHRGVPAVALTHSALLGVLEQSERRNIVVLEENGEIGHDLCRLLIERFPELAIVQLGEGRGHDDVRLAHAAGAQAVVAKRPKLDDLVAVVNRLERGEGARRDSENRRAAC
jgi:DNA-binding NarL/FixJ family response regulator